jgi:Fic family protein
MCPASRLLEEMFEQVIDKGRQIKNPIEAAFFLGKPAYLQPFEDGNKRTSRLAANIPLMLYNCAPLSFMEVEQQSMRAMMGIYERCDGQPRHNAVRAGVPTLSETLCRHT